MEDLEREIENLLKFADWTEFHRQQLVGGKHTDEVNWWANFRKEQIRRHIRDMIQKYTYKLRLENQIYKEVSESNSKYVKLRSIVVLIIWIGIWLLISFIC